MVRFTKILAAFITAFAVLFSQLAVAMHPCPQLSGALSTLGEVASDCECPSKSNSASALCKKHCDNDKQNIAAAINVDAGKYFPTFVIALLHTDDAPQLSAAAVSQTDKIPPDPPLLKYANLRI